MSSSQVNLSGILSSINDAFSGKTSGIDVQTTVAELMQLQRQPETQMLQQQTEIGEQISLLAGIGSDMQALATAADNLRDVTGALNAKIATSGRTDLVTASATYTAAAATHRVVVGKLATVSSSYSDPVPANQQLGGTEIDVDYGDPNDPSKVEKILVPDADNTLQSVADYINGGSYGVTASILTDTQGSRLVLTSRNSGAAGNLTVGSAALNFTQGTEGVDAQLTVDGVPMTSAGNTVTTAIPGVTLNLLAASPDTPVTIGVANDTSQASQALNTFVSAYNTVIQDLNSQFAVDANGQQGLLAGNDGIRNLQTQLLAAVSYSVSGTGQYVNLQSLGLEMQDDGTLQVNSNVLNQALSNHFQDVQNFFQSLAPQGFANSFGTQMMQLNDVTQGPVAIAVTGLQQTNQDLTNDISNFEVRMTLVQQELTSQYSSVNALLVQYPMLMQQISAQLNSLSSSK